jgi:hypothetical protein
VEQSSTKKPRNNGSRRKQKATNTPIKIWISEGIKIGSINIRGLTIMKMLLLMDIEALDVICVQETWLAEGAQVPALPGFKVVE